MVGRFLCAAFMLVSMAALPVHAGFASVGGAVRGAPMGSRASASGTGTLVLRGSLSSTARITLRGALSIGHVTGMSWDLARFPTLHLSGYRQTVLSERFKFNVPPDSFQDITVNGIDFRRFHWNTPPANTVIRVAQHLTLRVKTHLNKFTDAEPYPLQTVSTDVQPFLKATPSLRLTHAQRAYVRWLVRHRTSERRVVRKVVNWVATHVRYDSSLTRGPYNAAWVLNNRRATCQGYASLVVGMLRALHIPAQVVFGIVGGAPVRMPTSRGWEAIQWSTTGPHDWINIYFPGSGWVSFDPQMEKFFVDTRHYAMLTEVDATNPIIGQWMAYPVAGESMTGRALRNGTDEVIPGDGWSKMAIKLQDSTEAHIASVVHDVHTVTLFSR